MTQSEKSDSIFSVVVINPGSTSTKIAYFEGVQAVFSSTLAHSPKSMGKYTAVIDQLGFRAAAIDDFMEKNEIAQNRLDAIAGRGGLLKPMPGGTYRVSDDMVRDLRDARYGEHASNLGAVLAHSIGSRLNIPAFIVDPVTTDEFEPSARISGVPGVSRRCRSHTLNIKAVARRVADQIGRPLSDTRFVVAHMGGGVSICALKHGRIIDSTDALLGEGPFSMNRAGTIASERVIEICFDQDATREEVIKRLSRESGFKGYLGETDLPHIQTRIENGEQLAQEVMDAFVLQVAKWIGAMAAVLECRVDSIILTGGMANSQPLVNRVSTHIRPLAPIQILPGELEMEALAEGAIRVLSGREPCLSYQ